MTGRSSLASPRADELIDAVARFIETVAAPQLSGHAAFHARVAVNALRIVERELRLAPQADARAAAVLDAHRPALRELFELLSRNLKDQ